MKSKISKLYISEDASIRECFEGYSYSKQVWCIHKYDDCFITEMITYWKEVYD